MGIAFVKIPFGRKMDLAFLLLPGYLFGVGNLLLQFLNQRDGLGESIAASLVLWSVIGWFSFNHFKEVVIVLSLIGTLWTIIYLLLKRPKFTMPVIMFFAAILLRYLPAAPSLYPYRKDFIMHTYATATILFHNGFGAQYYPFGVGGFGAFNIGFHFVSAGISILTGLEPINSVLVAVYIFWGVLFWALYRWTASPTIALITIFLLPYPLTYLRWGGFPTLAALSLGLLAFRNNPKNATIYWLGAFSIHFIPVSIPFLVYVIHRFRHWKDTLPYLTFLLLLPQYYFIFKYSLAMSPREMQVVDAYVVSVFPKAFVIFLLIMAPAGIQV